MPDHYPPTASRPHMVRVLELEARIEAEKPTRASQGLPLVLRAYEIATNGYRRLCLTSGQLQALEQCTADLEGILK